MLCLHVYFNKQTTTKSPENEKKLKKVCLKIAAYKIIVIMIYYAIR